MREHLVISYIHPGTVRAEFMESMLRTQKHLKTPLDGIFNIKSGPLIASARNDVVSMFLNDYSAGWLLMVDSDMVFTPEGVDKLVSAAEEGNFPILGGLCFTELTEEGDDQVLPTMYEMVVRDGIPQFATYKVWPEDQPFQVAATGAAFLLVHRDTYKAIASGWGDKNDVLWPWFKESNLHNKRRLGEDFTFCLRARTAGFPVRVHTGVQVGHMKSTMLGKVT